MKTVIYWTKSGLEIRDKICEYFGIEMKMTVNGETTIDIDDSKVSALKATEKRGLIQIRNKKWE